MATVIAIVLLGTMLGGALVSSLVHRVHSTVVHSLVSIIVLGCFPLGGRLGILSLTLGV